MKPFLKRVLFLLPLVFAQTAYGGINSILLKAAKAGDAAKVEQLLNQGADVKAKGLDGWTALMGAAFKGHAETVRILKQAGARK